MPEFNLAGFTEHLANFTKGWSDHLVAVDHILARTPEGQLTSRAFKEIYYPMLNKGVEQDASQIVHGIKSGQIQGQVDVAGIVTKHRMLARQRIGGINDYRFVTLARSIEKNHGPLAAQSYSNAVAFLLKDHVDPIKIKEHLEATDPVEAKRFVKRNVSMSPYASVKRNMVLGGVGLKDTKPTFKPTGKTEGAISSVLHTTFAPMIVIPHVGTVFNGLFGTTPDKFLQGAGSALTFSLSQEIEKSEAQLITGAFAETHMNALREWNLFKATGAPKWAANSPARVLYKILHQPGFRPLRDYTLLSGVNTAQIAVSDLAKKFTQNPADTKLAWHLQQFGLEPKYVLQNNGLLTREMMEQAVYRYVDNHYFIDNSSSRSMLFQGTPIGRLVGMYHGYVTRQSKLMARALSDGFKGGGALHTAKNLAIMATLFPIVGEIIKLSQMTVRGQDAIGTAQQDLENISGENGLAEGASTYFEAIGHMAAFGIYNQLLRGSQTHSIINEAVGPVGSSAAHLTQDARTALDKTARDGEITQDNIAPLERDVIYDTPGISTLAYVLGHRVLPKQNEDPDQDPVRQFADWITSDDDKKKKEKK